MTFVHLLDSSTSRRQCGIIFETEVLVCRLVCLPLISTYRGPLRILSFDECDRDNAGAFV